MAKPMKDLRQTLASRIFAALLEDIVMDTALTAHKDVRKLQEADASLALALVTSDDRVSQAGASQEANPPESEKNPDLPSNGVTKQDGNILLDCLNCKRPMASNRYAQHLASCMGLLNGARRGGPRNASKRMDSEGTRSASPQVLENGENPRKRPLSPTDVSAREAKRPKPESGTASPLSRNHITASMPGMNGIYSSLPRTSSKLRSSPLASQRHEMSPVDSERSLASNGSAPAQQSLESGGSAGRSRAFEASVCEATLDARGSVGQDTEERDPDYVDIDGVVDTDSSDEDGSE